MIVGQNLFGQNESVVNDKDLKSIINIDNEINDRFVRLTVRLNLNWSDFTFRVSGVNIIWKLSHFLE
jgi:hypothetical protein